MSLKQKWKSTLFSVMTCQVDDGVLTESHQRGTEHAVKKKQVNKDLDQLHTQ